MTEHPNVAKIRVAYKAFAEGDVATVADSMASDCVFHVLGHHPFQGEYKGHDEIFGFLGTLLADTAGTLTLEVEDVLANDQRATVLLRETAQRKGQSIDTREVHVLYLNPEGKITDWWELTQDQAAYDAFWSL